MLGPLEVRAGGAVVDLGPPRIRSVCALLLVRPGHVVAIERFVDELWPRRPPSDARALVRDYVSRLRRALGDGRDRVVTRKPGYLLHVEDDELDLHRFEELTAQARAAHQRGEPQHAVELFRAAHDLWRGDPFDGVLQTASITTTATWLTERRLSAWESRVEAALAAGDVEDVVADLTTFVTAHPMRERPAAQLMLALYRSGRQAEALEQYQRIRRALAEHAGVDPGGELRQLHQRILNADPTLHTSATKPRTPRQLPRDVPTLVGRDRELGDVVARLEDVDTNPVVVLHGAPGVGKSALATRAAHLTTSSFPDGQLHVNLRGASSAVRPLLPAEALHQLLRALGVAGPDIPSETDEAAAMVRTVVAGRRLLIVLDDVATEAQVRPLLPGCTVLITSRARLAALEGATHVAVGPLSSDAAVEMLAAVISHQRPAGESAATRRLAELCDRLPLGLHLAAARLNARPSWEVRDLVERLADERGRLTELAAGNVALRSSLAVSHAALQDSADPTDNRAARALCLFGLLPVTGIDLDLAAAVLDSSPADADRTVERLLNTHLVEELAPGRFQMHDLTRLFAHELGTGTVPPDEQRTAFTRLLDHYLATIVLANRLVYPHRAHHPTPETVTRPKPLATPDEALRWLDEQRHNVITVIRQAWSGPPEHAGLGIGLALALHWYLLSGANGLTTTISFQEEAVAAAERLDDRRSQAYAHGNLAGSMRHIGRLEQASTHSAMELAICREIGDRFGEQRALGNLGYTHLVQHRPEEAIHHLQRQLELARDIDAPIGQAFALVNLGKAHHLLGRSEDAIAMIEIGLAWYERTGDLYRQCDVHEVLARIHIDLGRHDRAVALSVKALDFARRTGYRFGEIWALTALARAHRLSGNTDQARLCAEQAVTVSGNLHGTQARTDALTEYARLRATTRT